MSEQTAISEPNQSQPNLPFVALLCAGVVLAIAPLASLFINQRTLTVLAIFTSAGEGPAESPLPWLDLPIAVLHTITLTMGILAGLVLLANAIFLFKQARPRWIPALGVTLGFIAVLGWAAAYRTTFIQREILLDFGLKSP